MNLAFVIKPTILFSTKYNHPCILKTYFDCKSHSNKTDGFRNHGSNSFTGMLFYPRTEIAHTVRANK